MKIRNALPATKERKHLWWEAQWNDPEIRLELSIKGAVNLAVKRDAKIGIKSDLTREHIRSLLAEQNGLCAIYGLPFDLGRKGSRGAKWNSMSIDAIEAERGHIVGNVRLVLWCYNSAKGRMTDADMLYFARRMVDRADAGLIKGLEHQHASSEKSTSRVAEH